MQQIGIGSWLVAFVVCCVIAIVIAPNPESVDCDNSPLGACPANALSGRAHAEGWGPTDQDASAMLQVKVTRSSGEFVQGHAAAGGSFGDSLGDENLCIDGHLVPEFFLLGLAKAATTSFAFELMTSPDLVTESVSQKEVDDSIWGNLISKESHMFDQDSQFSLGKSHWESRYPECQLISGRKAAADFSPTYLTRNEEPAIADRIHSRYGIETNRLKFMILLREPLSELQSMFYYAQRAWGYLPSLTFRELADDMLDNGVSSSVAQHCGGDNDCLEKSAVLEITNYVTSIDKYLRTFDARQFLIVPMQLYTRGAVDNVTIAESVGKWLHIAPPQHFAITPELNPDDHPKLEEDLDAASQQRLRMLLAKVSGAREVAKVLAKYQSSAGSPWLYGYSGDAGDVDAMATWLSANW